VAILVRGLKYRTQFWMGTTQESSQQNLVEIGPVVSEEKIFFKFHPPFFLICIIRTLWEIPIKIFLSETICSIRTKFWWNGHWMVIFQKCVQRILVGGIKCQTYFWKGTTQGSFQQNLVEIGSVVSEEKIFF
jgi:hypothetical protein